MEWFYQLTRPDQDKDIRLVGSRSRYAEGYLCEVIYKGFYANARPPKGCRSQFFSEIVVDTRADFEPEESRTLPKVDS